MSECQIHVLKSYYRQCTCAMVHYDGGRRHPHDLGSAFNSCIVPLLQFIETVNASLAPCPSHCITSYDGRN